MFNNSIAKAVFSRLKVLKKSADICKIPSGKVEYCIHFIGIFRGRNFVDSYSRILQKIISKNSVGTPIGKADDILGLNKLGTVVIR